MVTGGCRARRGASAVWRCIRGAPTWRPPAAPTAVWLCGTCGSGTPPREPPWTTPLPGMFVRCSTALSGT